MPGFQLKAIHKPSGEAEEFGPYPFLGDEMKDRLALSFTHGFVRGVFGARYEVGLENVDDIEIEVSDVPDGPTVVGSLVAEASASVTHADGTVD